MQLKTVPHGQQGTWFQAIVSIGSSILLILGIRWALLEPYVIPSGSMIPNLLIHDHILVNKFAYGLHLPFSNKVLFQWSRPKRGDIIVFRSVTKPEIFLVKRVVGVPGDQVNYLESGNLEINGKVIETTAIDDSEVEKAVPSTVLPEGLRFFREAFEVGSHIIARSKTSEAFENQGPYDVPADHLFMMGDNRDNSADSRVWGMLPLDHVLGRASLIWLSCDKALASGGQLCDPKTIRWQRIFNLIH